MLTQRHEEKTAPASRKERERGRVAGSEAALAARPGIPFFQAQ